MKFTSSLLLLGAFAHASPQPQYGYGQQPACPADKCFSSIRNSPKLSATAYSFCKSYITRPTSTSTVVKTTTQTYTTTPKARGVSTKTVSATGTSTVTATPAQQTVTQLVTATSTARNTITPGQNTVTSIISVTTQETTSSVCATTTVTSPLPTTTFFRVRGQDPQKRDLEDRSSPSIPKELSSNCGSGQALKAKISSACACFLPKTYIRRVTTTSTVKTTVTAGYGYGYGGQSTVTTTVTSATVTSTVTASAPADATFTTTVATNTVTATVTASQPSDATVSTTTTITSTSIDCQTATATTFSGANLCGPVSATTYTTAGTYTCTQSAATPGETVNRFRIEGASEGNVFDGCISTGPRTITTPSGGSHLCDGTNNNANPSPGGTFTTDIDSAGRQEGFGFDGSYSSQFQDFFITSISQTSSSGSQFWGVLRNRVFTARGGCQEQVSPNDEALWAFDAFASNRRFLSLDRDFAVVRPGDNVQLTILAGNPNDGSTIPAQGATIGTGSTAGSDGSLTFTAPTAEGCYLYKAELTNAIRSEAFYLSVVNSFGQ